MFFHSELFTCLRVSLILLFIVSFPFSVPLWKYQTDLVPFLGAVPNQTFLHFVRFYLFTIHLPVSFTRCIGGVRTVCVLYSTLIYVISILNCTYGYGGSTNRLRPQQCVPIGCRGPVVRAVSWRPVRQNSCTEESAAFAG